MLNKKVNKGFYFINVDKYKGKTSSELWEREIRSIFFAWIFVLLAFAFLISLIYFLEIIFWIIDKDSVLNFFSKGKEELQDNAKTVWFLEFSSNISGFILSILMLILIIISIKKCKINKSFKYISYFPTMFIFWQAMTNFVTLFKFLAFDKVPFFVIFLNSNISLVFLMKFIMIFVYPLIWFFISRNVSAIRNIAINVETREKNEGFNFENPMIFDGNFNSSNNSQNQYSSQNGDNIKKQNEFNTNYAFYLRLKNLSRDQLNIFAKNLYISGYESMSDDELIKIIYDIKNVQDRDSSEREIKLEEDDKKDE